VVTNPTKSANAKSSAAKKGPSKKHQIIFSDDESEVAEDARNSKRRRVDSEADDDGVDEWDPTELDEPFENETERMDIGDHDLENDHEEDEGFTTDDCDGGQQVVAVRNSKAAVFSV
jgi:hypothetical protein